MTSPAGTVNYTYWIDGALKTREVLNTSGNPVTYSNNEYNPAGMLKSLTNKTASNGSTRSSYDMTGSGSYDGVLNLKSVAASVTGLTSFTGTLNWNYDSRERLTSETSSARTGVMGSASYDGADNVLTRGSSGWSYNSNNQITPSSGQWSYDGNGNATLQRGRSCGFDPFNRLGTITQTNTWSVGYSYRADGLMASRAKTIYMYAFGQWTPVIGFPTYYFHDGGEPILEMDEDFSEEGSGLIVSAINVRGPDGLIARKQGGSWIYYDFDQQGSVSQRLNASGTVLSSSVYDAYGAETNNGTPTDPFGYCAQWGYWFDRDTGMYLCQARWYDPATARWVNRDPIGYAGGANLYGYCGGGPVGWSDASGLQKAVIVLGPVSPGYQTGLQSLSLLQMKKFLKDSGYLESDILITSVTPRGLPGVTRNPEFFGFIGHASGGNPHYADTWTSAEDGTKDVQAETIDWTSITQIFVERSGRPFKHVWLMGCYTSSVEEDWFAIAEEVWTYGPYNNLTRPFARKARRPKNYTPPAKRLPKLDPMRLMKQ